MSKMHKLNQIIGSTYTQFNLEALAFDEALGIDRVEMKVNQIGNSYLYPENTYKLTKNLSHSNLSKF